MAESEYSNSLEHHKQKARKECFHRRKTNLPAMGRHSRRQSEDGGDRRRSPHKHHKQGVGVQVMLQAFVPISISIVPVVGKRGFGPSRTSQVDSVMFRLTSNHHLAASKGALPRALLPEVTGVRHS